MTFEEWIVMVCRNKKPLKQPYEDWYVCMREAFKAGYNEGFNRAASVCSPQSI